MRIDVITAFPGIIEPPLKQSIIKRAREKEIARIHVHNLREWAAGKHKTIDDTPYGGGAGMVYKVEPLYRCLNTIVADRESEKSKIVLTSPRGKIFQQELAVKFSLLKQLVLICGHYKGVDARIRDFFPIEEISVGDFILTGGEVAALTITDAVVRLLPGSINDVESAFSDSFSDYLLDCEYYTKPAVFMGKKVPQVLLSGNHERISKWRNQQKIKITKERRPDLYKKYKSKLK